MMTGKKSQSSSIWMQLFRRQGHIIFAVVLIGIAFMMVSGANGPVAAQDDVNGSLLPQLSGFLVDDLDQPVVGAEVSIFVDGEEEPSVFTESSEDGSWVVDLLEAPQEAVQIEIERAHFELFEHELTNDEFEQLVTTYSFGFNSIVLENHITIGFWIAGLTFVLVLLLIALERLQNALAALTGISIIFVSTFVLGAFSESFYILDLERAITYINWEVIFLVMGMMIIIGVFEGTGIFQWLAFQAYRASGGRISLLIVVLVIITSIASALLDNVTTMLLMAPISLQIALALGINPMALLIPEILASNVSGISTLIGTPTNILIGAYADIGFNDFLINQTAGVVVAMVAMTIASLFFFREDLRKSGGGISEVLYNKLQENAAIQDPRALKWSGIVFAGMLFFFVIGESIHMVPAVTALVGATLLLLLVEPDIEKMLGVVDWTTLVFFMMLFMMVGAVQEVGILSILASVMGDIIGESLVLGIVVLVFGTGFLSIGIANVPLAAAMLPVVRFLSNSVPGAAESNVLYYALSMGAAMGGNGFIISGETNLMTAGIAERAGYRISFKEFAKIGLPVTFITLTVGAAWLYIRFV
jgi:Na+/H+ antiporter NhaD/arsenite permease-like protein